MQQQGPPQTVTLSSGRLQLQGAALALMGGGIGAALGVAGGNTTSSAATNATTSNTAAATGNTRLLVKNATLSGHLALAELGVVLRVGPSTVQLQRAMQWAYNKTTAVFTTRVTMTGSVGLLLTYGTQSLSAPTSSSTLACQLSADMELQSALFPGA
jgi:hypothetical protein